MAYASPETVVIATEVLLEILLPWWFCQRFCRSRLFLNLKQLDKAPLVPEPSSRDTTVMADLLSKLGADDLVCR
jgi:hypothetical protein